MGMVYKKVSSLIDGVFSRNRPCSIYQGDCINLLKAIPSNSIDLIFSSPPYCIGKEYESTRDVSSFIKAHEVLFPELVRVIKPGGSLCWQTGMHVKNKVVTPLDALIYAESIKHRELVLRNRVIWTFGHGLHCSSRFSGRHESIMWFTKGDNYSFNLDAVRVSQKYPGKTATKGAKKGQPSSNPLGKNPGDVWNIPNVKSNHIEKTEHPCQFPVALPQIFIRALAPENGLVLDPFSGSGSTAIASIIEGRRFLGAEICENYNKIAKARVESAMKKQLKVRPWDKEVAKPNRKSKVATPPDGHVSPEKIMDSLINDLISFS